MRDREYEDKKRKLVDKVLVAAREVVRYGGGDALITTSVPDAQIKRYEKRKEYYKTYYKEVKKKK